MTTGKVRVEILVPFKDALGDQAWRAGEVADVDRATACRWAAYGYAMVVEVPIRPDAHPPRAA